MSSSFRPQGRPLKSSVPPIVGFRRVRFNPTEDQWNEIAAAAALETVRLHDRCSICRVADRYVDACWVSERAVSTKALIAKLDQLIAIAAEGPAELSNLFDAAEPTTVGLTLRFEVEFGAVSASTSPPRLRGRKLSDLLSKTRARLARMQKTGNRVRTRGESRDILIASLATIFTVMTGRKETLVGDPSSYGKFSLFIHFLSAFWAALPTSEKPPLSRLNDWAWREREKSGVSPRRHKAQKVPLCE